MYKMGLFLLVVTLLGGCVVAPQAPRTTAVMPAPGKSFEQFTAEDRECRDWAGQSTGNHTENGQQAFVNSAVLGTAVGAVAGALIGGNSGAAAGAGGGLLFGSMMGADQAERTEHDAQRRYDIAYQQCMYSKGNQVKGYARPSAAIPPPPPRDGYAPPMDEYPPASWPPPNR